jgi:hypothetical protein
MTILEAVTERILFAIEKRDFEELAQVSRERGRLLAAGSEVTLRAWELGEDARVALADLRKTLVLESSRLQLILKIAGVVPPPGSSRRAYFG